MDDSSTWVPSCTITIVFAARPEPTFTYFCFSQPPPWQVSQSGDIYPATRSRVIEFNLQSHPTGAKFIGFKVATSPLLIQDQSFPPSDSPIPVRQISATRVVLNDNGSRKGETIWYSPGVKLDGIEYWGDPKIYNPPDD